MEAVEFFKTASRLCKNRQCKECTVCKDGMCMVRRMAVLDDTSVENIEEIEKTVLKVEQWAKDYPVKTRQSEFLKKFPDAKIGKDGALIIYPCAIEKRLSGKKCGGIFCDDCRREYWLEEVTDND